MERRLIALSAMLGRHQIASLISTAVDFGAMIAVVELAHLSSTLAAGIGATCGALVNFQLGRHFTFAARAEHPGPQAVRYALVSGASAGLNALGEHVLAEILGVQYMGARVIVSIVVSLLWNFPMQRWFVFRANAQGTAPRSLDSKGARH